MRVIAITGVVLIGIEVAASIIIRYILRFLVGIILHHTVNGFVFERVFALVIRANNTDIGAFFVRFFIGAISRYAVKHVVIPAVPGSLVAVNYLVVRQRADV